MLTPFDIEDMIARFRQIPSGGLSESRRRREKTRLYTMVLQEIASGKCPDPMSLAKAILKLEKEL